MLDFLTRETFKISGRELPEFNEHADAITYPTTPGIIYFLDSQAGTFTVKGMVTESIASSFEKLELEGQESYDLFLSIEDFNLADIHFFSTPTYERAEMVFAQLGNKRFPYNEEMVCNLSDPGFSWWLRDEGSCFKVFFRTHAIERSVDLVRVGPIGDPNMMAARFTQIASRLEALFPVKDLSFNSISATIGTESGCELDGPFDALKELFFRGDETFAVTYLSSLPRSVRLYFEELAAIRKFWMQVEGEVLEPKRERLYQ